jgi:hypothetical protein
MDSHLDSSERLFLNSINSPYTKKVYKTYLTKFLVFCGMNNNNVSELLEKDHKEIEKQIIEFIIQSREKGMKRAAIMNYTCPVISFCKINDIMLNTTKINKFMPPQVKSKKTYGYTHEQIQKLLDIADERMRLVILLASHGLRIGAIPGLSVGSCEEYKDLYKITVYENESEEYIVFSTSELKKEIISYLDMRRRYGEVILTSSPLVRELFDRRDQFAIAHPRRIKESALSCKLTELAEAAGLRTKVQLKEGQQAASIRSEIPRTNGFRRFYCGILAETSPPLLVERRWKLEGHNLKGNDSAYLKITTDDLYNQFMLAHDNLLIDQSHKLKRKIEVLTIEKSKVDLALSQIEEMKKMIGL